MKKRLLTICLGLVLFCAGANEVTVEGVDFQCRDNNTVCDFHVTLLHADEGWEHYANRWEVLSVDDTIIATRVLHHPHEHEQPFTRSLTEVGIPKGTTRIKVRGHDNVDGYGKSIIVDLVKP